MQIKILQDEDFINYKKPAMFISFPSCTWKCERDCGKRVCQNSPLSAIDDISVNIEVIINRYINNPITKSIVCGGLEPFDSFNDLLQLISHLRVYTNDDIVIYTGYNKEEIIDKIEKIIVYKNIIIKYGRFIPDQEKHFDEILGVHLASDNQYAEKIS
ncbi:hypothetical protein IMSAG049_01724 [Clostridiales bacterium]|nr:hypothetical protein IMSAG049_01724 [Clostridiales bacterium]